MNNYNKTLKQLILSKLQRKQKGNQEWTIKNGQSRMDNQDTQATLCTQDTVQRQTK